MSYEGIRKRCVIQKLDFENCIVTNFKTTARGRKKLRARITREFHQSDLPKEESSTESPGASSPILLKKHSRNAVIVKRKKIDSPDRSEIDGESEPGSPVFKTHKKPKTKNPVKNLLKDLEESIISESSNSPGKLSPALRNSFQIDEFTQESKQSEKIYSVESPTSKTDTSSETSNYHQCIPTPICESPPKPVKKNYKKKSLLGRLQRLQMKKASEKLLFQHQNPKSWGSGLKVSVDSFWKEELNYFLKCHSSMSDVETIFVIIDSRWVPNVRNVKESSVVELYPPWQKLLEGSVMTVLNVICLNVLEETEEPVRQKKTLEEVPTRQFEVDQKLLIDSLFSSKSFGFLF